jgi:hypothetical protein
MSAIKHPPLGPPTAQYGSTTSVKTNNLKNSLWQFKYQYIYDDDDVSSFSPISKVALPFGEEFLNPSSPADPSVNNRIIVQIQGGAATVTKIRIAARRNNIGDFFEVEVLDAANIGGAYNYDFYNDGVYNSIEINESNKLYDRVPQLAKGLEMIDGNRLVYGNIVEGYDNVVPNITLTKKFEKQGNVTSGHMIFDTAYYGLGMFHVLEVKVGYHFTLVVTLTDGQVLNMSYVAKEGDIIPIVIAYFVEETKRLANKPVVNGFPVASTVLNPPNSFIIRANGGVVPVASGVSQTVTKKTFKSGSTIPFGIQYYDYANRSGAVNKIEELYIESMPEREVLFGTGGGRSVVKVDVDINHQPPSWATHYQIMMARNSTFSNFIQFNIGRIKVNSDNSKYVDLYIDTLNIYGTKQFPNSILSYGFTKGDRIRFISDAGGSFVRNLVDLEIVSYDTGALFLTVKDMRSIINEGGGIYDFKNNGVLAEIYTPRATFDDVIYYEIGEKYNILDAGKSTRRHQGQGQDQNAVYTLPAKILLTDGDVYYKSRLMTTVWPTLRASLVEDYNYSDFYTSNAWDIGRPGAADENAKQIRRPTTVYFTDPYIPETSINGLASISAGNFKSYDRNYGTIQRMFSENKRLILFQEKKVGAVPVNSSVVYDQLGGEIWTASENILNPIVYYKGEWGISRNPESFAEYGGVKYFTDVDRGVVMRLSNDGLTPISAYFMSNTFNDVFAEIMKATTRINIYGVFDIDFGEYIISVEDTNIPAFGAHKDVVLINGCDIDYTVSLVPNKDGTYDVVPVVTANRSGQTVTFNITRNVANGTYTVTPVCRSSGFTKVTQIDGFTVAFSELMNRWSTYYSYLPEFMCQAGIDIVTFRDGRIFLHNSNSVYNNFYGIQYSSEVHVVFNDFPDKTKIFQAMTEQSTGIWYCPNIKTPIGQLTNLIDGDFQEKEGKFHADFYMDVNSPNITDPLIEGNPMRDETLEIEMKNDELGLVVFYDVSLMFAPSERSDK